MRDHNRFITILAAGVMAVSLVLSGCGSAKNTSSQGSGAASSAAASSAVSSAAASSAPASSEATGSVSLADGEYSAKFTTDSSMFHVNETLDNTGTMTVKDGKATIHVSLASKNIVNLFAGKAEDAKKEGAALIKPSTDEIKYPDGKTDEVYGFDIPVPAIDREFDCALLGTKGNWYDHKVKVTDVKEKGAAGSSASSGSGSAADLKDGEYKIDFDFSGGSGRGGVETATLITGGGQMQVKISMTSNKYTKCVVDGKTYENTIENDKSTFTFPAVLDKDMKIVATTTAMSQPHDIEYTIKLKSASLPAEAR